MYLCMQVCVCVCTYACMYSDCQNNPLPWQHQHADSVMLFQNEERRGGKNRRTGFPFSFPGRRGVATGLSRGHATHIASRPQTQKLDSTHLPPSAKTLPPSLTLSLPCFSDPSLSTTYMSISLLAATWQHSHQSLSLSAALTESMVWPRSRC